MLQGSRKRQRAVSAGKSQKPQNKTKQNKTKQNKTKQNHHARWERVHVKIAIAGAGGVHLQHHVVDFGRETAEFEFVVGALGQGGGRSPVSNRQPVECAFVWRAKSTQKEARAR